MSVPGYSQIDPKVADALQPLSDQMADICEQAFKIGVDLGETPGDGMNAMVGVAVKVGLNIIAKAMEQLPGASPDFVVNHITSEIQVSTAVTFAIYANHLIEAAGTTKQ